ncbi:hypothetical protein EV360DRAFT_65829 [Lentinula raphanica]|nr:hypothetical protein EV360DRAFT_65829 [Lentinula raphanica]
MFFSATRTTPSKFVMLCLVIMGMLVVIAESTSRISTGPGSSKIIRLPSRPKPMIPGSPSKPPRPLSHHSLRSCCIATKNMGTINERNYLVINPTTDAVPQIIIGLRYPFDAQPGAITDPCVIGQLEWSNVDVTRDTRLTPLGNIHVVHGQILPVFRIRVPPLIEGGTDLNLIGKMMDELGINGKLARRHYIARYEEYNATSALLVQESLFAHIEEEQRQRVSRHESICPRETT